MRKTIEIFDAKFAALHVRSCAFLEIVPPERLYWQTRESEALFPVNSCGEFILRSAAAVEQTFGGLTTRLWDDPFEWTLPEALPTPDLVRGYLGEVESTRLRGFTFLKTDADLAREIPAPEKLRPIIEIFIDTLTRAAHYQGRAFAVLQSFSDVKLPK